MKTTRVLWSFHAALSLALMAPALAQEPAPRASEAAEAESGEATLEDLIQMEQGPCTSKLGQMAEIRLGEEFRFANGDGTRKFLELTQNIPSGGELGLVMPKGDGPEDAWFAIFEFNDTGYVKDDDKDELDADDLLDTLRENNERGNEIRKERGWATMELAGWDKPPFYDKQTNNLSWSLLVGGAEGQSINYSTRLLGRRGYMDVDLVLAPEQLAAVLPKFQEVLSGFSFREGHRYAEFTAGDKVADYGLAALVAGGAGVVAAKTGLLAKFWKAIVIGIIALGTFFKKAIRSVFGGSKAPDERDAAA